MQDKQTYINISNRTIVRLLLWALGTYLTYQFIGKISHGLKLIFVSFFLALALNPIVSKISHRLKSKSRVKATAGAYSLVMAVLVAFFAFAIPPLVTQTRDFVSDAPKIVSDFQQQDSALSRMASKYKIDEQLSKAAKDFAAKTTSSDSPVLSTSLRIGSTFISILTVIVMTFMMLVEGPKWLKLYFSILPKDKREYHEMLAHKMYKTVTAFVNGQVIVSVIAGVASLIALLVSSSLLHVSVNAVALASIVALFGLIPMIGNPLSSIVVILVCLLSSPNLAIVMLIYFLIYYQIENVTIQPYIQSRQNELTPLLVFVAALIGIGFGGMLGAIVAIPAAGCIKIIAENQYQKRRAS